MGSNAKTSRREEDDLVMNVNIAAVCALGTRVLEKVRPYREQLLAAPIVNKQAIAQIEEYLAILKRAHERHLEARNSVPSISEIAEPLTETRRLFLADCEEFIARGLMPSESVRGMKGVTSPTTIALDVLALTAALRAHWGRVRRKSAMHISDVERAEADAEQLLGRISGRQVSDAEPLGTAAHCMDAFVRFAYAYEEMAHAMMAVRWNERDEEEFVPRLFSVRSVVNVKDRASADASSVAN